MTLLAAVVLPSVVLGPSSWGRLSALTVMGEFALCLLYILWQVRHPRRTPVRLVRPGRVVLVLPVAIGLGFGMADQHELFVFLCINVMLLAPMVVARVRTDGPRAMVF